MVEKDYKKAQRLNEVYKHLFAHDKVKSQTDFADKLKVQRTGLSAAMNGAKANLTKEKSCFRLFKLSASDGRQQVRHARKRGRQTSASGVGVSSGNRAS